jgi:predicted NUDIX family NTP pyrophosphohydrolase
MPKRSAGILLFRRLSGRLEVLLVHPGGPFWTRKDDGAWSIPKGEHEEAEDPLAVAKREFEEELGSPSPAGEVIDLGELVQPSRKRVRGYAIEGDFDAAEIRSNSFETEWPPRSGRLQSFPEVDRAAWFSLAEAETKFLPGQRAFLGRLLQKLDEARRGLAF